MTLSHKRVLYVEDDIDDREFFFEAMQRTHPELFITTAVNGEAAFAYLKEAAAKNDLPDLIVLDINLPVFDGKELMEKLKADPALQHIPVVIFTSSESPADKEWAERLGLSLYNKPYDLTILPDIVKDLLKYMR